MKKITQEFIDSSPLCEKGKTWVTELLGKLGHEVECSFKVKPGQVYSFGGNAIYVIIEQTGWTKWNGPNLSLACITSSGALQGHHTGIGSCCKSRLVANTLEEYYDKKRKGEL